MAKRNTSGIVCPRCGVPSARVIGRSEALPVLYLRCDDCGKTSVSPE
jgi:DNA-directed RNA polymerase subunit RPC12/RpoP